jgi:hypothetical protein
MNITSVKGNWVRGTVTIDSVPFAFSAKVYPEPSEDFAITDLGAEGHVSKLDVTNEREERIVMRYDRGWSFNLIPHTGREILSQIESEEVISAVSKNLQTDR